MSVSISAVHRCLYGPGELLLSSGFMLKLKRKPALKLVPKVDEEFAGLIAPLSSEEYQQLEANLIAHGCRDALVVWRGLLLDGHNRLELSNHHGIPYDTAAIELPDRESAKLWLE